MKYRFEILLIIILLPLLSFSQEKVGAWLVFNTNNSPLPNNNVRDIQVDKKGQLWIGTWGGGLSRYDMFRWRLYDATNSGLKSNYINEIAIDKKRDRIWATNYDKGITCFDGNNWVHVPFDKGIITQSIAVNDVGTVLIGTESHGLYQYVIKDSLLSRVWGEDNNVDYGVLDIAFDNSGFALIGTRQGLFKFYKDPKGVYTAVKTELRKDPTSKIEVTEKGDIWAINAETSHLMHYDAKRKKWRNLPNTCRLIYNELNGEKPTYYANELAITPDQRILAGTKYNGGLTITHYKTWGAIYTPYSGKRHMMGSIEAIALDQREALWVGTWHMGLMTQVGYNIELDSVIIDTVKKVDKPIVRSNTYKHDFSKEVQKINRRRAVLKDTIHCRTNQIEFLIWDQQRVDGDTVTIMLNDEIVLDKHCLTKEPLRLHLTLKPDNNKLIMYAHNLGDIPPNTAQISILELGRQKELTLQSDLSRSHAVNLIYNEDFKNPSNKRKNRKKNNKPKK